MTARRVPDLGLSGAPGREHDVTCAKAAVDLLPALEALEVTSGIPTLTGLGSLHLGPAIRHSCKKPKGSELTEEQVTYNKIKYGVRGIAERADSLLKTAFEALRRVGLPGGYLA